jgi:hypothetical protein
MKTLIVLLLISSISFADSINFGVWTDHSVAGDFNENNRLVAVEINNNVFASFINSYDRQSYIAARQFMLNENIGFMAGVSHGYDSRCFKYNYKICMSLDEYKKEINPYASIKLSITHGIAKITLLESIKFRTIVLGFDIR